MRELKLMRCDMGVRIREALCGSCELGIRMRDLQCECGSGVFVRELLRRNQGVGIAL